MASLELAPSHLIQVGTSMLAVGPGPHSLASNSLCTRSRCVGFVFEVFKR